MKFTLAITILAFLSTTHALAAKCTKKEAKAAVEKMCALIEKDEANNGKNALKEVVKFRYCGDNYVWIQDSDVKMVRHPIKRRLNNKSLKESTDPKGKKLFIEFDKMAKSKAEGGWVEYLWPKVGSEVATDKISFVKKCGGKLGWIAGSGIWVK